MRHHDVFSPGWTQTGPARPRAMFHHQLHHFFSQAASVANDAATYLRAGRRGLVAALSRVGSPRDVFREALQQAKSRKAKAGEEAPRLDRHKSPLLLHYHIFKNAGTSFEWALQQAFGKELRLYDTPRPDGFISQQDIVRYVEENPAVRAIASHQAAPPAPKIRDRQVLTSILIRDPMARVRSIYAFERLQHPSASPGPVKAKELDFKGYVEWRMAVTPRMFCNFQVHYCCRDGTKWDPPLSRQDLHRAIAALDDIDIVGTVERYEEWLALAQSVLAEQFGAISLRSVRHNQSAGGKVQSEVEIIDRLGQDLGMGLAAELLDQNELDMCLHQVADSLLTRRLAERSIVVKLREAYRAGAANRAGTSFKESLAFLA